MIVMTYYMMYALVFYLRLIVDLLCIQCLYDTRPDAKFKENLFACSEIAAHDPKCIRTASGAARTMTNISWTLELPPPFLSPRAALGRRIPGRIFFGALSSLWP